MLERPNTHRAKWIGLAVAVAFIPAALIGGYYLGYNQAQPNVVPAAARDGWTNISMSACVGYAAEPPETPPPRLTVPAQECSARFRLLERNPPLIGFTATIATEPADPQSIPQEWREDLTIGDWVYEGETQLAFAGHFEFTFVDEHGFDVVTLESGELHLRSGQANSFQAALPAITQAQAQQVRSATGIFIVTRCYMCEARR